MNCQNFESIVNDLARDQIMEAVMREQAVQHSASCATCSSRLREEQLLTEGLRELGTLMQEDCASDDVKARLVLELRSFYGVKNPAGGKVSYLPAVAGPNKNSRRYWNYAAAAGIVIAVALGVAANRFWRTELSVSERGPAEILPAEDVAANTPAPVKSPTIVLPETPIKHASPRNSGRRANPSGFRVARNTVTVQSLDIIGPAPEVTTDFIPIGYANASNVQEGGQVVRLELPRYAMARFGVPVNEERYDERVKADVWVSADGLARAIRFVQ